MFSLSLCLTGNLGLFLISALADMPHCKCGNDIVLPVACLKNVHKQELQVVDAEYMIVQVERLFGHAWSLVKPNQKS